MNEQNESGGDLNNERALLREEIDALRRERERLSAALGDADQDLGGRAAQPTLQTLLQAAQSAARAMILLNGGAAITLMTFFGNLLTAPGASVVGLVKPGALALLFFGSGAALGVAAILRSYEGQFKQTWRDSQVVFNLRIRGLGEWWTVASNMLFILGLLIAFFALNGLELGPANSNALLLEN